MSADGGETTGRQLLQALAPLATVAGFLARFGRNPVGFIASVISLYIVNSVLNLGAFAINSVLGVFNAIVGAIRAAQALLTGAFAFVGVDILGIFTSLNAIVAELAASAGPFGPPLIAAFAAVSVYLTYRVAVALLGELPIGSSVVDLLGLR